MYIVMYRKIGSVRVVKHFVEQDNNAAKKYPMIGLW